LQDKMKLQPQRELSGSTISRCNVRMPLNRKRLNWEGCNASVVGFLRNNPGSVWKDSEKWGKPQSGKPSPGQESNMGPLEYLRRMVPHCTHRSSWNCLPISKYILFPRASNPHLRESFWATVIGVKFRIFYLRQYLSWGSCRDRVATLCIHESWGYGTIMN
jgi:hypothetical protein